MRNIIGEIIRDHIESGCLFDSHYIIKQLLIKHSSDFYEYIRSIEGDTEVVHGHLAQVIASFEPELIQRPSGNNMSWSENIHGNSSKCTAWIKG